jgi:hypothetical protein
VIIQVVNFGKDTTNFLFRKTNNAIYSEIKHYFGEKCRY